MLNTYELISVFALTCIAITSSNQSFDVIFVKRCFISCYMEVFDYMPWKYLEIKGTNNYVSCYKIYVLITCKIKITMKNALQKFLLTKYQDGFFAKNFTAKTEDDICVKYETIRLGMIKLFGR